MSYFCVVKIHEFYIKRCIELAKNGLGSTYPNPMVGSVIVHNNKIIGEGWHKKSGEPHAEVNAIQAVKDKSLLSKATIYVSLEPCSHFGKTPPCADLIIAHQIPNVVIGTQDPFAKVAGNGIKKLKENGTNVVVGVLEKECQRLNQRFITFHTKKRPYIILKWAESADGFIAPKVKEKKEPVWLSGEFSRQLVHKWRSEEQAIMVGTQTVIDDNPSLTTRNWYGPNPVRIVLDQNKRIPKENTIFDNQAKTIPITSDEIDFSQDISIPITELLYQHHIQSVIIEGGKQTLETFISANLWDEARIFKSPLVLKAGIKAPEIEYRNSKPKTIDKDELLILFNNDYNHNF